MLNYIYIVILSLTFTSTSYANDETELNDTEKNSEIHVNNFNKCNVTQGHIDDYEPQQFILNNNLLRKTGEIINITEPPIIVSGEVVDQYCNPVSDVKIYMWHADQNGEYPYNLLRVAVDHSLVNTSNETSFTGNGTATTNNQGQFQFITIYPGTSDDAKKPYINIRTEHYRFGISENQFKLQETLKPSDTDIVSILEFASNDYGVNDIKIYRIRIVIER